MQEILEKVQKIQSELFGKKTVFVDTHIFDDDSTLIHITIFADRENEDDMKSFDFRDWYAKETNEETMRKLLDYVEYAKKI